MLGTELKRAGVEWCVDIVVADDSSRSRATAPAMLRVRVADVAAAAASGTDPVTLEMLRPEYEGTAGVEALLARAVRKLLPRNVGYLRWLRSQGEVAITVREDVLEESLGECLHASMRKAMDSEQSCIGMAAVRHLKKEDWLQMLDLVRVEIAKLREDRAVHGSEPLTRKEVGLAMRRALVDKADCVRMRAGSNGEMIDARSDLQEFALTAAQMAFRLTTEQEWVHGWTAYLCEEVVEGHAALT